jgi:hypothetical protein
MNNENVPQPITYYVMPSSTLATVSLISGILGFIMLPVIGSVIALWAGYAARKETRSIPPRASGDGLATAGIVMGWIQIGLMMTGACCLCVYFTFMAGLIGQVFNNLPR